MTASPTTSPTTTTPPLQIADPVRRGSEPPMTLIADAPTATAFHPQVPEKSTARRGATQAAVRSLLGLMATMYNRRPALREKMRTADGWIDMTAGIRTRSGSVSTAIRFREGKAKSLGRVPVDVDVTLVFKTDAEVRKFLTATSTEQVYMILRNDFYSEGNSSYLNLFVYLISVLMSSQQIKGMDKEKVADRAERIESAGVTDPDLARQMRARAAYRIAGERVDPGVQYLEDPYLRDYSLEDFPRLGAFLERHLDGEAEVCPELPSLITEWHKAHGFETDGDGRPWEP